MPVAFPGDFSVQTTYQWVCGSQYDRSSSILTPSCTLFIVVWTAYRSLARTFAMTHALRNTELDAQDEAQVLDTIDRWVTRELKPIVREYDHADRYPTHIVEQMKELGLFGSTISPEYGGLGLTAATYAKVIMSISSVWMSITGIINSHLMLALAIEKFGTSEQKAQWLPKIASGEIRGGLALTEPDAGTDLQGIRTTAKRDGDHYVINGTKMWITNAVSYTHLRAHET